MDLAHPSAIERWLLDHASPEPLDSARALYELMPRQRGGQLPFVDVPYDARREEHWAEAARVADYVAHAPEARGGSSTSGPAMAGPRSPSLRRARTSRSWASTRPASARECAPRTRRGSG